jgi:hypothetical protein
VLPCGRATAGIMNRKNVPYGNGQANQGNNPRKCASHDKRVI